MNKQEIFKKLDNLNISKVYISFFYEKNEVNIISNMIIMKDERYSVDWGNDVYDDKSYITQPIFEYEKGNWEIIDGLLTWDVINKKLTISGKKQKCVEEKFSEEI